MSIFLSSKKTKRKLQPLVTPRGFYAVVQCHPDKGMVVTSKCMTLLEAQRHEYDQQRSRKDTFCTKTIRDFTYVPNGVRVSVFTIPAYSLRKHCRPDVPFRVKTDHDTLSSNLRLTIHPKRSLMIEEMEEEEMGSNIVTQSSVIERLRWDQIDDFTPSSALQSMVVVVLTKNGPWCGPTAYETGTIKPVVVREVMVHVHGVGNQSKCQWPVVFGDPLNQRQIQSNTAPIDFSAPLAEIED